MKEKILNHIREVCNLKRLEFGCEVCFATDIWKVYEMYNTNEKQGMKVLLVKDRATTFLLEHISNYKIIGLPVELSHLLQVLDHPKQKSGIAYIFSRLMSYPYSYALNKSVSENLDNPDLCNLIAELLDPNTQ